MTLTEGVYGALVRGAGNVYGAVLEDEGWRETYVEAGLVGKGWDEGTGTTRYSHEP